MTIGRDAQPDIRFQGDGLARGLHRAQSRVNCLARNIRFEIGCIRRRPDDAKYAATARKWIKAAWGARREAQQGVVAYRGLIAEREQQRGLGLVAGG